MSIVISDEVNGFDEVQHIFESGQNVAAFAVLREQLIKNIGLDRVKGFLLRYGYELGVHSGKKALQLELSSIEELIRQGPQFHSSYGHVQGILYRIEIELNNENQPFAARGNGVWKGSFEGLEHLSRLGISRTPVCYTLTGYISGYMSTLCQNTIVARETSCIAMGNDMCTWEFKPLEEWGEEIHGEYSYYFESPIIQEFEYTYEQLLEQRNYMYKVANLHKKLTDAITNGCNLKIVAEIANDVTGIPIIISDINFQTFAYCGLSELQLAGYTEDARPFLTQTINEDFLIAKKRLLHCNSHYRLIAPIMVKKKVYGYCTFIYSEKMSDLENDYMFLERIANASALYLLNEKTSFDASERMRGHFLEQLLDNRFSSRTEILKRGRFMNIDLSQKFVVAILEAYSHHTPLKDDLLIQEQLPEAVNKFFRGQGQEFLSVQRQGKVVLLLPFTNPDNHSVLQMAESLVDCLQKKFPGCRFRIGMSRAGEEMQNINDYYKEALIACRMTSKKAVTTYNELGIVGILINSHNKQAIRAYAEELLGCLYKNKDAKMNELLKTLYFFLANGGKLEHTMKDMSLSMSGLLYRIKKIETMIGKDLRDPMDSHQVFLALQALVSIGDLEIY